MHHVSPCQEISSMIRLFLSTLEVVQAVAKAKMVTPKKYSNTDFRELRINYEFKISFSLTIQFFKYYSWTSFLLNQADNEKKGQKDVLKVS